MADKSIEAVARAICRTQFQDEREHGTARCCQLGGTEGCCLPDIIPLAQAAVVAFREHGIKEHAEYMRRLNETAGG